MMSLRGLGNFGTGSGSARLAATYYQEKSADYYVEDLDHEGAWMGQGAIVERAFVYGYSSESIASQRSTYVPISRAKGETKLFVMAGETGVEREVKASLNKEQRQEALKEMKQNWSYDAAKDTTLEYTKLKQKREEKLKRGYERS